MAFTSQELSNIANAALDFYVKGPAFAQSIQDKPLMKGLEAGKKYFPGGKENISIPVKGDYTTAIAGFSHNDTVSYANPANIKRVVFPWKQVHAGISFTGTELLIDGISVDDTTTGKNTSEHSDRDTTVLTGLLEDKLDDMMEGWAITFNRMLWNDGTQDAKQVPGILSILTDTPTTGTTGGLDRATATWWRHRTLINSAKLTVSVSLQTLTKALRTELRQLRRYAKGTPNYLILCGSAFLTGLEAEIAEKGYYTQTGFQNNGKNEIGMADMSLRGLGTFTYDPTLDDLGAPYNKRCYVIDLNAIKLRPITGEDKKTHNPARPYNQYVFYRAMTWAGGLTVQQLNTSGIYEIA